MAKVSQQTVSSFIKKFTDDLRIERTKGSGQKSGFQSTKKAAKALALLEMNPGLSNRKVAEKVGCSEFLVRKFIKS